MKQCVSCGREFEGEGEYCPECAQALQPAADPELTRRKFLTLGVFGIAGSIGVAYLGIALRYLIPQQTTRNTLQDMGPVSDFPVGQAVLKSYNDNGTPDGVYILNYGGGKWAAFDFHCTHLQCPVHWSTPNFYCPCHGSVFNEYGQRIAGPAPRPLYQHYIEVRGGRVLVGGIVA